MHEEGKSLRRKEKRKGKRVHQSENGLKGSRMNVWEGRHERQDFSPHFPMVIPRHCLSSIKFTREMFPAQKNHDYLAATPDALFRCGKETEIQKEKV